jgi:hypothetical protein
LRLGRNELADAAASEVRSATVATVSFTWRAGEGGRVLAIALSRLSGGELVDVERWIEHEELAYSLAAPLWDRFGLFAGQPRIVATVKWTAADRSVVIAVRHGGERFGEAA